MVWDGLARRFYIYDRDGDLIKESSGDNFQAGGLPLDNGTFYEILVFDFEGRLIRKIRKEFARVPVTSAEKSALLAKLAARRYPSAEKIDFPAHKPPFQYFFADEKGRLFVVTTERDEETGQNIYDIFNREGVLIGRRPIGWFDILRQYWELLRLDIAANHGRLYVLREKDSGFEELIVFRAAWR